MLVAACGDDAAVMPRDSGPCVDDHDEDKDAVGDSCDICPASPDPRQLDSTEAATMLVFPDGVGDACDPRPGQSGDKLGAFHPFFDPATMASWNGAGFTIASDVATATATARWTHRTRELGDGIFVQARLGQLAWSASGRFELVVDGNGVDSGLACAITKDRDGDTFDELEAREVGGAVDVKTANMEIDGAITITAWRIIDVNRRGRLRCRVSFDGGMVSNEIATLDDAALGIYGMASDASTTEVASLVVYTSPTLPEQMP